MKVGIVSCGFVGGAKEARGQSSSQIKEERTSEKICYPARSSLSFRGNLRFSRNELLGVGPFRHPG
jgi:hypothetical protein